MPQKKKEIKKVLKKVIKNSTQPILKNSININIDLDDNNNKKKKKTKKKKEPLQEIQPQTQQPKQPNRKFGSGYIPSSDTPINTFNNNLVDMAIEKIKRYTASLGPPIGPPQLPAPQPQLQLPAPQPQLQLPAPQPQLQQYYPPVSMPIVSLPPSTAQTPSITAAPTPALTPVKPPQQPSKPPPQPAQQPAAAAAGGGKPPPPPPPPPPPAVLPSTPSLSAASDLAAAAAALSALRPMINDIVNKIIADSLMDGEIMATGAGRNMKFAMHFNSLVDPQYRNSPDILRKAYNEYKKLKGIT